MSTHRGPASLIAQDRMCSHNDQPCSIPFSSHRLIYVPMPNFLHTIQTLHWIHNYSFPNGLFPGAFFFIISYLLTEINEFIFIMSQWYFSSHFIDRELRKVPANLGCSFEMPEVWFLRLCSSMYAQSSAPNCLSDCCKSSAIFQTKKDFKITSFKSKM